MGNSRNGETHERFSRHKNIPHINYAAESHKIKTHSRTFGRMPVGRCDISSRAIVQFDNHFAVEVACSLAYLIMNI